MLSVRTQDDITFLPFYLKKDHQTANQISSISISFIGYTSVFSETKGPIETKLPWSRISKMATIAQCYLTAMVNMSSQKIQIWLNQYFINWMLVYQINDIGSWDLLPFCCIDFFTWKDDPTLIWKALRIYGDFNTTQFYCICINICNWFIVTIGYSNLTQ